MAMIDMNGQEAFGVTGLLGGLGMSVSNSSTSQSCVKGANAGKLWGIDVIYHQ